jgi:hypothetical protein
MNLILKQYLLWMPIGASVTAFNCTLLYVSEAEDKQYDYTFFRSLGLGAGVSIATLPVYPLVTIISSGELIHECMDRATGWKVRRKLRYDDLIAERDWARLELKKTQKRLEQTQTTI